MNEALFLSKAAITRMCHDLAGVVGAVTNGLELLGEEERIDPETFDLVKENASVLFARTVFFRAAFGNEGPLTGAEAAERILKGYLSSLENRAARYSCEWHVDSGLPLFSFRLILLAAQLVAERMIKGGVLSVTAKAGENKISVCGEGERILALSGNDSFLSYTEGDYTSKDVARVFLAEHLCGLGWTAVCDTPREGVFGLVLTGSEV